MTISIFHFFKPSENFSRMLDGSAGTPLVYRTLVPSVTKALVFLSPSFLQNAVNSVAAHIILEHPGRVFSREQLLDIALMRPTSSVASIFIFYLDYILSHNETYQFFMVSLIMYICLLAYAASLFLLGRALFPHNRAVAIFAPIIGMMVLPGFEYPTGIRIYDFPQLMFTTLCLYCMGTGRLRLYLLIFALSCVNKETTIFLSLFFAVWFRTRQPLKSYTFYMCMQICLFLIIKLTINYCFRNNPEPNWFLQTSQVRALFESYTFSTMFNILFLCQMIVYKFVETPLFLRYSLILIIPQYLAYLLFCAEGEYRNFFEVLPIITIMLTHTIMRYSGIDRIDWLQCSPVRSCSDHS